MTVPVEQQDRAQHGVIGKFLDGADELVEHLAERRAGRDPRQNLVLVDDQLLVPVAPLALRGWTARSRRLKCSAPQTTSSDVPK